LPIIGDGVAGFRPGRCGLLIASLTATGVLAAACNLLTTDSEPNRSPNVHDQVNSIDLLPRFPQPAGPVTVDRSRDPRAAVYNGSDEAAVNKAVTFESAEPSATGEGYDLNFENAPVATVAKVILGDILGAGYIIDPRVQGTVTLTSGRSVAKSDVLFVLESALRASNIALVRETAGYRLVPSPEAVATGRLDVARANGPPPQAGYGISVIPLRYVSAATLTKLVENFAARQGTIRVDATRNMILIQGSGPERRAAVETVLSFDTDWMQGQTVGIFPVRHSAPEPVISEIERIMDAGDGGLSKDLVKLQPIARLNAILVVARKPQLLKTAETWIRRLDNSEISSTGVKVYRVRYGDARNMAKILTDMFIGGASANLDTSQNQLAPGAALTTTTSGPPAATNLSPVERLTGGPPPTRPAEATPPPGAAAPAGTRNAATNALMPGVRITADLTNNALLIYASEDDYRVIERALHQIDRPQLQVAFDATIAEVTLNDSLTYGVQFFLKSTNLGAPPDTGSVINTIGGAVLNRVLPGFNILVGSEATPQAIIDGLHAVTDVKILSNPSLVVVDNGVATLVVGDQVPIATGTATVLTGNNAVVNTINYQNTGIILRVVPRVGFNNMVTLDIEQEISAVSTTNATGILTPTISQRKVRSTLSVADGQTVLLAGLVSETQNKTRNGIPVLDQLPGLVGDAFSHQNKTVNRTELIIFIRPQIIRDTVDAHLVAEQLRSKLKAKVGTVAPKSGSLFEWPATAR
jgi:general secretion pathway protein D